MMLPIINFLVFLFLGFPETSNAYNNPIISADSVKSYDVISGVKYIRYIKDEIPWSIDVLEIDLTRKDLTLETAKGKDRIFDSRERTSEIVKRRINAGINVIGAINADFFDMKNGNIENNQILNGEFVKGIRRGKRSQFAITYSNYPVIEKLKFEGKIILKNGEEKEIDAVNVRRGKDSIVVYNSFWGSSTNTSGTGVEYVIKPVGSWKVNENIKIVILNKSDSNTTIINNFYVISGDGKYSDLLSKSIRIGDTIQIYLGTNPRIKDIKESVGGLPQIVKNGIDVSTTSTTEEGGGKKFITDRHPRTAIGFNKDNSKLFLMTVDGRQKKSLGMSLPELSEFMISIGCYQVLNLDGGGSTTMIVQGKIVNSPSDLTGERAVGNALLLIKK